MADKPKTKEEFIKFFDREIKRMDNEITETLKDAVGDSRKIRKGELNGKI
jgi:hypothetical protein